MRPEWWQLAGPRRFVDSICEGWRAGRHTVAALPAFAGVGLFEAVTSAAAACERLSDREHLTLPFDESLPPLESLCRVHAVEPALAAEPLALPSLFRAGRFVEKIIWVRVAPQHPHWSGWVRLIQQFAQLTRAHPVPRSTLFCVLFEGDAAADRSLAENFRAGSGGDINLAHHRWDAQVDLLDALQHASHCLRGRDDLSGVRRKLALWTITHLALWDPALIEALAREDLKNLLNPGRALRKFARDQCRWTPEALRAPSTVLRWEQGTSGRFDDEPAAHSAALALRDLPADQREIHRRLWHAAVTTMLPFVEFRRQDFLKRLGHILDARRDLAAMEIGELWRALNSCPDAFQRDRETCLLVKTLWHIRNEVAHLRPVTTKHIDEFDKHWAAAKTW